MEVKQAIAMAKAYAIDVFSEERVSDVELEEVELRNAEWRITVSFSRPLPENTPSAFSFAEAMALAQNSRKRVHKVVVMTDDGEFVAIKDRAWMESAG